MQAPWFSLRPCGPGMVHGIFSADVRETHTSPRREEKRAWEKRKNGSRIAPQIEQRDADQEAKQMLKPSNLSTVLLDRPAAATVGLGWYERILNTNRHGIGHVRFQPAFVQTPQSGGGYVTTTYCVTHQSESVSVIRTPKRRICFAP